MAAAGEALRKKIAANIRELEDEIRKLKGKLRKKPRGLTARERIDYLRSPVSCPYCGGKNLEGGFVDIHTGSAAQPVHCADCDRHWHDVYKLTDIEERNGS